MLFNQIVILIVNQYLRQQHILPPGKVEDETITGYVVTTIISSAILTAGGVMLRIMLTYVNMYIPKIIIYLVANAIIATLSNQIW